MTDATLESSVRSLSDRAALELARRFGEELRNERDIAATLAGAPAEWNESMAASEWIRVDASQRKEPLAPDVAIAAAWTMIEGALARPSLRPALERANTNFHFDDAGPPSWITRGLMGLFSLVSAADASDGAQLAEARRQAESLTRPECVHFLDAVPFDLARVESRTFYEALVRTYRLNTEIATVVEGSRIEITLLVGANAAELWFSALRIAANRRRLRPLAHLVLHDSRAKAIRDEIASITGPEPMLSDDLPPLPQLPPKTWAPWLMTPTYEPTSESAAKFVDICSFAFPRRASAELVCGFAGLNLLRVSEALAIVEQWQRILPLSFAESRQQQLAWQVLCAPDTMGWRREMSVIVGL